MSILLKQGTSHEGAAFRVECPTCGRNTMLYSIMATECVCKHAFPLNIKMMGKSVFTRFAFHVRARGFS